MSLKSGHWQFSGMYGNPRPLRQCLFSLEMGSNCVFIVSTAFLSLVCVVDLSFNCGHKLIKNFIYFPQIKLDNPSKFACIKCSITCRDLGHTQHNIDLKKWHIVSVFLHDLLCNCSICCSFWRSHFDTQCNDLCLSFVFVSLPSFLREVRKMSRFLFLQKKLNC